MPMDRVGMAVGSGAASLYESDLLSSVSGPALRPGGTGLTARAISYCDFPEGARLLDVGCGSGASVGWLRARGYQASGVDLSPPLLAAGRAAGLPLARASAEALPGHDGSFDGVLCECVFCLLKRPARALREFHRVLRPGGRLILTDLYRRASRVDGELPSRQELEAVAGRAGFHVEFWEDHSPLLAELAAQLVLAHGSLQAFCKAAPGLGSASERPGYYLLVAAKPK
jgi:arsenite methyltransferase